MFKGEYEHSLDSKNRIIIPSKFREDLGQKIVMSKGLDGCLYVFTEVEWKKLEKKLMALPLAKKEARAFSRFFFGGATEITLDSQFRALIPQNLLEYASINKEIVSIGMASRIEIWSKESWEKYQEEDIDLSLIAEQMGDLGI